MKGTKNKSKTSYTLELDTVSEIPTSKRPYDGKPIRPTSTGGPQRWNRNMTIENTSNGNQAHSSTLNLIECACQDVQGRDMWLQKIQACITKRDAPLISFENFHSCISQAAWSNRMLDQIPLAEIEQISNQVAISRRSRNSLESLKRQSKLLEKTQNDTHSCVSWQQLRRTASHHQDVRGRLLLREDVFI